MFLCYSLVDFVT